MRKTYKKLVRVVRVSRPSFSDAFRLDSYDGFSHVSAVGKFTPIADNAALFQTPEQARKFAIRRCFSIAG